MSRLIDADLLRAEFTGNFHEMWHYTGIWAMIDCAPTAYDIDKVIEQLWKLHDDVTQHGYEVDRIVDVVEYAIEIVKKGGA